MSLAAESAGSKTYRYRHGPHVARICTVLGVMTFMAVWGFLEHRGIVAAVIVAFFVTLWALFLLIQYSQQYTVTPDGVVSKNLLRRKLEPWQDIRWVIWFGTGNAGVLFVYGPSRKIPRLCIPSIALDDFDELMTSLVIKAGLTKVSDERFIRAFGSMKDS